MQPSPTPPVASPTPPAPVPLNGEITITSISPVPGATVPVHACAAGSPRFCADRPRLTIDVVVDQDIPDATLTASFGGCAIAWVSRIMLATGVRQSLATSVLDLSDDGPLHDGVGAALYCRLPAVTGKLVVSLWRQGQARTPVLTREFVSDYTFAMP